MRKVITLAFLGLLLASCAGSSPEVRSLAEKTGANVGVISAQLERLGRNSRDVAELRADNIARLHGANARLRAQYEIDIELTKKSGGEKNLALIKKVKAWRDKVQAILDKAENAEAERKEQILKTQTSLDTRKKALAEIAQGLAALANEETAKDRVRFLKGFAKELKTAFDEAIEADTKSAKAAKSLLDKAKKNFAGKT
jgi:hypothetical protein